MPRPEFVKACQAVPTAADLEPIHEAFSIFTIRPPPSLLLLQLDSLYRSHDSLLLIRAPIKPRFFNVQWSFLVLSLSHVSFGLRLL